MFFEFFYTSVLLFPISFCFTTTNQVNRKPGIKAATDRARALEVPARGRHQQDMSVSGLEDGSFWLE